MPSIVYDPLDYQERFHNSRKPKVYLSAGYGAGKTYALVMKMFGLMDENRNIPGGLLCPTIAMYKRDVLPTIREILESNGIMYRYNKSELTWYFPNTNSTVYVFHSQDDGASIRGPNLAWGCANEVSLCSDQAFLAFLARIRVKNARLLQLAMSGTPEEFNWAYEYFLENPREDTDFIFGDSRKNIHISEGYVQQLIDSYDEQMVQQFVEGKFVNLKGKAALYTFDRKTHVAPVEKDPELPVLVSVDFNVDPMAATLWNRVPQSLASDGVVLRAFDEICLHSADTYELARAIRSKTTSIDQITLYPDPAGGGRHTSSKGLKSDISILKDQGFEVRYKSRIRIRECLNAANAFVEKGKIKVDPKCRNFILDAEQCKLKDNVFELEKKNPKRTHWLDGFKNMVDYEFPIVRTPAVREGRYR